MSDNQLQRVNPDTGEITEAPKFPVVSYEGIASANIPDEAMAILGAPCPPELIKIRPDGMIYVDQVEYRNRLLRSKVRWSIRPVDSHIEERGTESLVYYKGQLWINGCYQAEAVGEQAYYKSNNSMTYGTAYEASKSNCLVRCCKDLGMFAELWNKEFVEAWKAANAETYYDQKRQKTLWRGKGEVLAEAQAKADMENDPVSATFGAQEQVPTRKPSTRNANIKDGAMLEIATGFVEAGEIGATNPRKSDGKTFPLYFITIGGKKMETMDKDFFDAARLAKTNGEEISAEFQYDAQWKKYKLIKISK